MEPSRKSFSTAGFSSFFPSSSCSSPALILAIHSLSFYSQLLVLCPVSLASPTIALSNLIIPPTLVFLCNLPPFFISFLAGSFSAKPSLHSNSAPSPSFFPPRFSSSFLPLGVVVKSKSKPYFTPFYLSLSP